MGDAVDGDLSLLHRLEQRSLGLRRRAVDLVGQQDLREHGSGPELELVRLQVQHRRPGHIGRHEVRRELHPLELQAEQLREHPDERGLADARDIVDQDVVPVRMPTSTRRRGSRTPKQALVDVVRELLEERPCAIGLRHHRKDTGGARSGLSVGLPGRSVSGPAVPTDRERHEHDEEGEEPRRRLQQQRRERLRRRYWRRA